jgi:hypothetical protein
MGRWEMTIRCDAKQHNLKDYISCLDASVYNGSLASAFSARESLIGSSSSVDAMSCSQSVLAAFGDTSIAEPILPIIVTLGPTTPILLRVREEIVEAEPKRRRPAKVLRCAPTLIDSDDGECEGLLPPARNDGFQPATTSSQQEARQLQDSGGFQPVIASSLGDSLLALLDRTVNEEHEIRVELGRRQRSIDLCLAGITFDAPHDDDLGAETLMDEAVARAHTHELRAAEDAIAAARAARDLRTIAFAAARESSFEEEARLLIDEPCICAQALELFEGDFEKDCAMALQTARRIINTLPASENFYIGLCASPKQRWRIAGYGHMHTWARMCLCGGFESHRAALVESRAIEEFIGQYRCANQRSGGGGRGPQGSLGFVYVCHGDGFNLKLPVLTTKRPASNPQRRTREKQRPAPFTP